MNSRDNELRQERDREVSQERKQRLLHIAGDIALLGNWKKEPLTDCHAVEGVFPESTTININHNDYPSFARIDVRSAQIVHKPSRIDDNTVHPEEVNVFVVDYKNEGQDYVIRGGLGAEAEHVTVSNTTEIDRREISGLEVSLYDALKLQMMLTAIVDKIDESLATP